VKRQLDVNLATVVLVSSHSRLLFISVANSDAILLVVDAAIVDLADDGYWVVFTTVRIG
jgi:hypothetical protein